MSKISAACLEMTLNIYLSITMALFLGLLSTKVMKGVRLPNVTGYLLIRVIAVP